MSWPFGKKENENMDIEEKNEKPNTETGEKTPAELIAESVSAALKPFVESQAAISANHAALNQRLDSIEQNTRRPEPRQEGSSELVSVMEDENLAFAQRIGPVLLRQLETEARMTRSEVKQEYITKGYGEVWAEFDGEINKILEASPVVGADSKPIRGNPDYIRNVVDMVFGRAAIKAGIRFGGREKGFFLESTGGGDSSIEGGTSKDGLTPEQRRVFTRMGVSLSDGAKSAAKLKFVN